MHAGEQNAPEAVVMPDPGLKLTSTRCVGAGIVVRIERVDAVEALLRTTREAPRSR